MTTKIRPDQITSLGGVAPCQTSSAEGPTAPPAATSTDLVRSVVVVDDTKTEGFIGIELVDHSGKPVANAAFVVTLPDGKPVRGALDQNGKARIEGIDPGKCVVTFPTVDRRDFV